MAFSNYGGNVSILADMVYELYLKTVELDKQENRRGPVYLHIAELKTLGNLLVDRNS